MRTRFFYLSVILLTFNIILTQNSIKADAWEWASNNIIPHSSNLSQNKYYPVTGATGDNIHRDRRWSAHHMPVRVIGNGNPAGALLP